MDTLVRLREGIDDSENRTGGVGSRVEHAAKRNQRNQCHLFLASPILLEIEEAIAGQSKGCENRKVANG